MKLPLFFQLSVTTWYIIGFHGNHSYVNDVRSDRHLVLVTFQILSKFDEFSIIFQMNIILKMMSKQHLWINAISKSTHKLRVSL